jgi:ParB family chromosome partitioning protein
MDGPSMSGKREKPYGGKLSALDTLFGEAPEVAAELIPIDQIKVRKEQPRRYFGDDEMRTLISSVREHGVLQPVLARPLGDNTLELVAGERRLRAAAEAGLIQVPVVVREMSEEQAAELAIVENLQRESLNPVEETDAILNLLSARLKKPAPDTIELLRKIYDEVRGRPGNNVVSTEEKGVVKSFFASLGRFSISSFYTHRLPLLRLPEDLLDTVRQGRLEYTKALAIAKIKDRTTRADLIERAVAENLSLVQLGAVVKELRSNGSHKQPDIAVRASVVAQALRKRNAIKDTATKRRVEKLLAQLEEILAAT